MVSPRRKSIRAVVILVPVLIILALGAVFAPGILDSVLGRWICTTLGEQFVLSPRPEQGIRFAALGDFGGGGQPSADVAELILSWNPDFIITTGDNNYEAGGASTIDQHVGQYYHAFIGNYRGEYGEGAEENRFFPTLGNHDLETENTTVFQDYFDLPGNGRYYDFVRGPVHFFALNSNPEEPDGVSVTSEQARWLQTALAGSTSAFNIVYLHHPPFSSGKHGDNDWMNWPFQEWGVDAVIAGHDHTYERIMRGELLYFVNGLGGRTKYRFGDLVEGSQAQYDCEFGAMLVDAAEDTVEFRFINTENVVVDYYLLTREDG